MDSIGSNIISSLGYLVPQFIIAGACLYYLMRKSSVDAILLAIGSGIGALLSIFNVIIIPVLYESGYDVYSDSGLYFQVIGPVGLIGSLLFASGLIVLINSHIKAKGVESND